MTDSGIHGTLSIRPGSLPGFAAYSMRQVGDPANVATDAELAALHPRAVAERRSAFVAGRSAAHAVLSDLDSDVPAILVGPMRQPLWPSGIVGSLSHAGNLAVAIAAPRGRTDGVGIDIEVVRPAPELWGQVPLPQERRWLEGIADSVERDRMLLALFSAKESIYKAFFPRVGFYFGFEAALLEPTSSGFSASFVDRIDDEYPSSRRFEISTGWFGDMVRTWLVLPG